MTPVPQPTALIPSVRVAIDRFLARSRFAARTRDSYAQDLAPLLAQVGDQRVSVLTRGVASAYLAAHEHLAASTFNRRYAVLRSFARWCMTQGWLADDPLRGVERRPQVRGEPRALDPEQVEARLRTIRDTRDRALFWLIYDGALRCREALTIDVDDIDWAERCIRIHGKGDRPREMFFSRRASGYLDAYLKERGEPAHGAARPEPPPGRPHGGGLRAALLSAGGHPLETVHARLGSAPVAPHGHHRPRGQGLHRSRAQALQRAHVAAQPGGVHRP